MSFELETVPFTSEEADRWNLFAAQSDDAWFWHTTHWMDFSQELTPQRFVENLSFFVVENSQFLAICPVIMESEGDYRLFSYSGGPIPFPAIRNNVREDAREKILDLYVSALASLARERDVGYVSVKIPAVSTSYLESSGPFVNPLIKFGYFNLAYLTQVIDLRRSEQALWADVRKGHKSDIKRAARECAVSVWDQENITREKFLEYQELHRKDAGRVTRSQRTFDLMYFWIKQGTAVLVEANYSGRAVGFALLIVFRQGAYYGSSCKDPDNPDILASHLIQWQSILWLRERGFHFYDVGLQQFCPQWFNIPSGKDLGISSFKRGFGGTTIPLPTVEFFFSKDYLERTFERRVREYLASLNP